jgi:hypothetical protein
MNMQYEELVLLFAHVGYCWTVGFDEELAYVHFMVGSDRQRVMPVYLSVISDEACFGYSVSAYLGSGV